MKRALASLSAFTLALATSSCLSSNQVEQIHLTPPPLAPTHHSAPHEAPSWKLKLASVCRDSRAESCVASYGFSVSSEGHYQVGPGPQGQILTGTLKTGELKSVEEPLTQILSTITPQSVDSETCSSRSQPEQSESVTFSRRGSDVDLIWTSNSRFCSRSANIENAEILHKAIIGLARKYYPLPFPSACIDASIAVAALYEPLHGCQSDHDCAYIDNTFNPIDSNELQFVITDDCSLTGTLPVANRIAMLNSQERLLAARDFARDTCGPRMVRMQCPGITGFQSLAAPPVCIAGTCQIHPSIHH